MQKAFSKPQKKLMTRLVLKCHMSNLGHEFIVSLCNVSIGDAWTAVFCTYFFYQFEKIKSAQLDCFIALVTVLFYGTVSCPFSMMMQCLQNAMQCTTCGYFQSEGAPLLLLLPHWSISWVLLYEIEQKNPRLTYLEKANETCFRPLFKGLNEF